MFNILRFYLVRQLIFPSQLIFTCTCIGFCLQHCPLGKIAVSANMKHSIDSQISDQSTTMIKGCMYMFNVVDTTLNYGRTIANFCMNLSR